MLDRNPGHEAVPMLVCIASLPQSRSHQLNRSRLNVAHTIATFPNNRRRLLRKSLVHFCQFPTTEAMLPRIDQRTISINLFCLTHHKFGSAMRISFQVTKMLKKEASRWERIAVAGFYQR